MLVTFASALAPASTMVNPLSLFITGIVAVKPGRSIPLILPIINKDATNNAPVFPMETKASAFPSLTALAAKTRLEFFLRLTARTGSSSIVITSSA